MTTTRTDISIQNPQRDSEYVLILTARVSVPPCATRESGADTDIYSIRCASLSHGVSAPASETRVTVHLGDITRERAEAVCTHLANSGILERIFQTRTDAGRTNARIVDMNAILDLEAMLVDNDEDEIEDEDEETPGSEELASGWARYRVHTEGIIEDRVFKGNLDSLVGHVSHGKFGCAVWTAGSPESVVIGAPNDYVRQLSQRRLERAPIEYKILAPAIWTAGFRNVRATAAALNIERSTVYACLLKAGIDPFN
jgi:hypothetical protein